jgi:hypothetical protein
MLRRTLPFMKNYFFVDTNIIIGFQHNEPDIREFVKDPDNFFFYTETVQQELLSSSKQTTVDSKFQFFNSRLSQSRKLNALTLLDSLWKDRFDGKKHQMRDGFGLTPQMLSRFQNDLFVIFEASNSMFQHNLLPADEPVFKTPLLLTNNMRLVNKFILRPETNDLLETTINLSGFEHLIDVVCLEDMISEWKKIPK